MVKLSIQYFDVLAKGYREFVVLTDSTCTTEEVVNFLGIRERLLEGSEIEYSFETIKLPYILSQDIDYRLK